MAAHNFNHARKTDRRVSPDAQGVKALAKTLVKGATTDPTQVQPPATPEDLGGLVLRVANTSFDPPAEIEPATIDPEFARDITKASFDKALKAFKAAPEQSEGEF